MRNIFDPIVALSVVPIIPFLLVYVIQYAWKRNKNKALLQAMDVTTLFLILAVAGLFNQVFSTGFGFYLILLFMLVAGGLIGSAQNRLKGKVHVKKLCLAVWRLTFCLTLSSYVILFLIGFFPYIWAV